MFFTLVCLGRRNSRSRGEGEAKRRRVQDVTRTKRSAHDPDVRLKASEQCEPRDVDAIGNAKTARRTRLLGGDDGEEEADEV